MMRFSFPFSAKTVCSLGDKIEGQRAHSPGTGSDCRSFSPLLLLFSLVMFGGHQILDRERFSARESVLKFDLQKIRNAIDQYESDKNRAPNSRQDLLNAHYLREIPVDPIKRNQDWGCSFAPPD